MISTGRCFDTTSPCFLTEEEKYVEHGTSVAQIKMLTEKEKKERKGKR
jgi:hypothetical protein